MTTARARVRTHTSGPATPARKPAEPMLLDPSRCTCHQPTLIALELRHLRSDGCAYPAQAIDVETWRKPW